jgi:hypothetical protein
MLVEQGKPHRNDKLASEANVAGNAKRPVLWPCDFRE